MAYTIDQFRAWVFQHRAHPHLDINHLVGALTLVGEIRGGDYDSKIAVGSSFVNRTRQKGGTIWGRCLQPMQYSCWTPLGGKQNHEYLMALTERVVGILDAAGPEGHDHEDLPVSIVEGMYLVAGLEIGSLRDNTHGSTHYFVHGTPTPYWAEGHKAAACIGPHLFFNDIAW